MKTIFKSSFIKFMLFLVFSILTSSLTVHAEVDSASNLQDMQTKIDSAMHQRQTTYTINYSGDSATLETDIPSVVNNIYKSDDYLQYTTKSCRYAYDPLNNPTQITFTIIYWNTATQDNYVNTKVKLILDQIITPGMSDFQKQKNIHDWIEKNVSYDTTLVKHSDYDALVSPYKTVCQGYALLAYKMLNEAGIPTKIVEGTAHGQDHAWNLVYLDGAWYHFDPTWDDPVPDVAGRALYGYYNLTDDQIKVNHSWTNTYDSANTDFANTLAEKYASDPSNSSIYVDLFNSLELKFLTDEYTVKDTNGLISKIQEAMKNNAKELRVRFVNGSSAETAIKTAVNSIPNLTTCKYSIEEYMRTTLPGDVILGLSFTYSAPTIPSDPVSVTSVSLSDSNLTISAGSTSTLTATVMPSDATNKAIEWITSDPSVATVSNGVVKAINRGTAKITAITTDGGYTATCNVNVTVPVPVTGVAINSSSDFVKMGSPLTLSAVISPTDATIKTVTWSSSDATIATVSAKGVVIPVSTGSVTITAKATDGNIVATKNLTVIYAITSITLDKTSASIKLGSDDLTLIPTITPSNASNESLTWKSSNINVATVDSNGKVHAVAYGSAIITATSAQDSTKVAKCTITVPVPVTGVTINSSSDLVKMGSTLALSAVVSPSNATIKTVTWSSNDANIATVSSTGVVTPVSTGSVTITAKTTDGNIVATKNLTVIYGVASITLDKTSTSIKLGSDDITLIPTINPINASNKSLTWTSSNTKVATVDSNGKVHAVAYGSAIITATSAQDPTKVAKCTVTVPIPVTGVTINSSSNFVKMGTPLTLTAVISPTNATIKTVTWSSSDPTIATVSSTGVVTAVSTGSVTITAKTTDGNIVATKDLTVIYGINSITLDKTSASIKLGSDDLTLIPTINPTNASNKSLIWKSSNINVATVDSNGKVHAVAYGSAIITATSAQDSTKVAKCTVTVPVPVIGVTINSSSNFVKIGTPLTLTAVISPTNATIKTVTWSSSDPTIATVSSTGVVTPVATGSVTITAKTTDGNIVATKDLTVVYGITSITLDKTSASIKLGGDDLTLTPTINPTNASNKSLTWTSGNPNVAMVDSNGNVHAVASGSAVISATSIQDPTKVAKCTVTVTIPVTGVTINSSSDLLKMGNTLALKATISPSNATIKTVTWSSSDDSVAKVSSTGVVTPVSPGSVTITAKTTDGNIVATKDLTVIYSVNSITLNKTSTSIKLGGDDLTLIPTINPSNASNMSLIWTSSNTNVATVDSNGNVHAVASGSAIISAASVQDPTKVAKCTVSITN